MVQKSPKITDYERHLKKSENTTIIITGMMIVMKWLPLSISDSGSQLYDQQ